MKTFVLLVTLLIASAAWASDQREADVDRLQTSGVILSQIMTAPDRGIPDAIMDGAKCIAVVPSMLKASFIFGANYGKGVATCRTGKGWSAPVFFKMEGGSFGFQAGGQASDLVLIIRTEDGMQHLLASKFKLGGDASAAAGPVGRDAQAMTDLTMRAQVLTYSRARGLFLGVSVSGAVVHQAEGDTQAFYRKPLTFRTILSGQTPVPSEAESFLKTVEKYAPTPRANVTATASATSVDATTKLTETTPPTSASISGEEPTADTPAGAANTPATTPSDGSEAPVASPAPNEAPPDGANSAVGTTPPTNSADDLSGMALPPEPQPASPPSAPPGTPAPSSPAPYSTSKPSGNDSPAPVTPPTGKGWH